MAKPTPQQCHALTTYFIGQCLNIKNYEPRVNRNKARWGFESILMDRSAPETKKLIDFYIKSYDNITLDFFLYNYDSLEEIMNNKAKEEVSRKKRREETQKRLQEWEERWKKS